MKVDKMFRDNFNKIKFKIQPQIGFQKKYQT